LHSFILALLNPGEEAVMFEPGFPMFIDHVKFAGGIIKSVPFVYDESSQKWIFEPKLLRETFND
jgi:aspartate/methionine/tyrosine aminotransferase